MKHYLKGTFFSVILIFCVCILSGCLFLSEEEKIKAKEYEQKAPAIMEEYIKNKYDKSAEFSKLSVVTRPIELSFQRVCIPVVVGKAKMLGKEFDIAVSLDADDDEFGWDNYQKEEILNDINQYFIEIYNENPYRQTIGFGAIIGGFDREDGLLSEKYDGDIKKFLDENSEDIVVFLEYMNIKTIKLSDEKMDELHKLNDVMIFNLRENAKDINFDDDYGVDYYPERFAPYISEYIDLDEWDSIYRKLELKSCGDLLYCPLDDESVIITKRENSLFDIKAWQEFEEYYGKGKRVSDIYSVENFDNSHNSTVMCFLKNEGKPYYYFEKNNSDADKKYFADYIRDSVGEYLYFLSSSGSGKFFTIIQSIPEEVENDYNSANWLYKLLSFLD